MADRERRKRRGHIASARAVGAVAAAVVLVACSSGSPRAGTSSPYVRPSSTAHVVILEPTNGEVFHGSKVDVPVKLSVTGATIVPATTTHIRPDQGHVHIKLDNQLVTMNFSLTGDVPGVTPGQHTLVAQFVASDHLPFDPMVFTAVTFTVKP